MDALATGLSVAALAVSIWAARKSHLIASAQSTNQERLVKLETARERDRLEATKQAAVRADMGSDGRNHYLSVRNEGPAEARAITITVDGRPIEDHDDFLVHDEELARTLGPGAEVRYLVAISMGSPTLFPVELKWEDDTGQPGVWRSHLRWQ